MTYPQTIEFLYSLRQFGTKLGLENSFRLAELAGNPHRRLRFLHVAGTNGKGSVCSMLESIYRAAGLRTGLFTSPHLVSFTERIQVNREPIPREDVSRLAGILCEKLGGTEAAKWPFHPTFFEFVTVMALLYFEERGCDLVVWETGLGGRLDSTNIVMPLASVITNIQFDHQAWLGNTLSQIAAEKAGIIKDGTPVITGATAPEALEVIREAAARAGASLNVVDRPASLPGLPLRGTHQQMNASIALKVVETLQPVLPVSDEQARAGLTRVHWPGRLQLVKVNGREILLDGAHNPDGARALAEALQTLYAGRRVSLILGLFQDKAWTEVCEILVPLARRISLVAIHSDRTADPGRMQTFCRERWPDKPVRAYSTLTEALAATSEDPFTLIAGSLHLIGEAMEELHLSPSLPSERNLNEWDAANTRAEQGTSGGKL